MTTLTSDLPFGMGWDHGLTLFWRGKKDKEPWTWSYADDFLPILQRTHGFWVMRNALRHMHVLKTPMEEGPER